MFKNLYLFETPTLADRNIHDQNILGQNVHDQKICPTKSIVALYGTAD